MNISDPQVALQNLRHRAERRRLVTQVPIPSMAPAEVQQLVQELQVHQIELEMQYEELLLAQAEAETSRQQYLDLYDFAPTGYCTLGPGGTLLQLNLRLGQLLGETRQQLLGRRLALFMPLAVRTEFAQFLDQVWASPGQRHTCELAMRRAENTPFFAQLEAVATASEPDGAAAPPTCRVAVLDVTARRQAVAELMASEARFRATFEQSRDGMVLLEDHRFVSLNATAAHMLGYPDPRALAGRRLLEFWPERQPDGRRSLDILNKCMDEAHRRGWCRLEWQRYTAAGELVWDEMSFNPVLVNGQPLLHAAWRDITERKLNEQRLQESERRLQLALTASRSGIWTWDLRTDQVELDKQAQHIVGQPTAHLPFADLLALIHPDDRATVQSTLATARADHGSFDLEYRLTLPGGGLQHLSASGQLVYDEATNQSPCLVALVRDVTSRHLAEQQLNYQNRLLGNLLRNLPVLLGRVGPDHRFRELAGRGLRVLGIGDNELVGQLTTAAFPGEAARIDSMLAGQSESYLTSFEVSGGSVFYQTYTYFDEGQQEGVFFCLDITESEQLKEAATRQQLRQQQEVFSAILTTQEEERRRIAEALHNGLGQLLYGTRLRLDALPASASVRATQELLNEAIRTTRTISFELTPGILEDFGLSVALEELVKRIPREQLLVDLNLNGLDQPLPKLLQVAIYRIVQELLNNVMKHAQAQEVFVQVSREEQLHLSVEDDGAGFDLTEEPSHHGIGLAGIRTRVNLLGGSLSIQSRAGKGTGVFLALPIPAG